MSNMDARELIRKAAHSGVRLWVEDGLLRHQAFKGDIPTSLQSALQSNENDLIGELSRPTFRKRSPSPKPVRYPDFWKDWWQETQGNPALANVTNLSIKLTGEIRREEIETALERLTLRYELLRSRVELEDGVPCLLAAQPQPVPADFIDISSAATAEDRDLRVKTLLEQAIYAPLEDGQLYRSRVIKISEREFVVAFVIHHFVVDAFSCGVLGKELLILLSESTSVSSMPEPSLQYSDYLLAMTEWLSGAGLPYRWTYWKEKMRGAPPTRLPPVREPDAAVGTNLDNVEIHIDAVLRDSAARAATALRVPFPVLLLAANFAAHASTLQSQDIVLIMIHYGRDDPDLMRLIGFTINCFPVRVAVLPEMSCTDLLTAVSDTYRIAGDYQVPWALLMRSLAKVGVDCAAPIFNYMPARRSAPVDPDAPRPYGRFEVEQITVSKPVQTNSATWKSHELNVVDYGTDMFVTVKYMPSRYRRASAERLAKAFRVCLEAISEDPTRPLRELTHPRT
jgi:hypothetical protein